jgi:hypothetical protein
VKPRISSALVLWFGLCALALAQTAPSSPKTLPPADEKRSPASLNAPTSPTSPTAPTAETLAQTVARLLRESKQLSRYRIQVYHQAGTIDLTGEVADESQRASAIQIARAVPGVVIVRDWLQARESGIVPAQAPLIQPIPLPFPQPVDKDKGGKDRIDNQLPEPMPIFQAPPGMPNTALQPPPMPPYAWPTFAPYNNYSRVAYPQAYPYEQWPFIGPMYPFPRVPLGWRSVSLTWEDGHWWYHRNPTGHDWWRIRYW